MLELETYFRFILALGAVLALIAGVSWLLRRFGFERALARPKHQGRRLNIVEVRSIDPRHKLVLLSRDDCEHLIVVGPSGETLIESGIKKEAKPPEESGGRRPPSFKKSGPRGESGPAGLSASKIQDSEFS